MVWTYDSLVSELRIMISFTPAIGAHWPRSWLYRSASLKATSNRNRTVVDKFLGYALYSCLRALPGELSTRRVMPRSLACVSCLTSAAARQIVNRKADSTRALKTRQLRRLAKRVGTPTELSNEEIYKYARSNLDERF